jgi:hypothetical protein
MSGRALLSRKQVETTNVLVEEVCGLLKATETIGVRCPSSLRSLRVLPAMPYAVRSRGSPNFLQFGDSETRTYAASMHGCVHGSALYQSVTAFTG